MSPKELLENLEELLFDDLGCFENGLPAIWSEPPLRPTGNINGLACIINSLPETSQKGSTGGEKAISEVFVITLVMFDREKQLLPYLRKIQKKFSVKSIDTNPLVKGDYEQAVIRVRNFGFI